MARIFENPDHWRKRAHELRSMAAGLVDAESKDTLLAIALAYDGLAARAEERRELLPALADELRH